MHGRILWHTKYNQYFGQNVKMMDGAEFIRELVQHIRGEFSLEEAVQRIKYATHRLARRQYAWFRLSDSRIHWIDASEGVLDQAEPLVRRFLATKLPCDTMAPEGAEGS